ncbi:hypothetical protein OROHE_006144 [Orobanche hederae]
MIKLKTEPYFTERNLSQQQLQRNATSRKRKLKRKEELTRIDSGIFTNEQTDINELCDEILVHILSRMSLKEAARTSVLARRWRYLWRSMFGTLQFDSRDVLTAAGGVTQVRNFVSWVNNVLELHQGRYIKGMVVIFQGMTPKRVMMRRKTNGEIHSWVCFAVRKEVERLELRLSITHDGYQFPSMETLRSHCSFPFRLLRSLRLVYVSIEDEVVRYLLGSCPNLKELCIWSSVATKELRVVDPPSLRFLEVKRCPYIEILEISCESLASLAFVGSEKGFLKKVPNLRELTIGSGSFLHFISEPNTSSYSDQLVKLVVDLLIPSSSIQLPRLPDWLPQFMSLIRLELLVSSAVDRSLLFFTWMIKASLHLREFRIEMTYCGFEWPEYGKRMVFPAMSREEAVKFDHRNLEVVELWGHVGFSSEKELLLELLSNASSIKRIFIDTRSEYYRNPIFVSYLEERGGNPFSYEHDFFGATSRAESKAHAKHLVSALPCHVKLIVS